VEKHSVASRKLGTIATFAWRQRKIKILCRGPSSQQPGKQKDTYELLNVFLRYVLSLYSLIGPLENNGQ
jgi:hypothetical protein